jgi:hypothetical protein
VQRISRLQIIQFLRDAVLHRDHSLSLHKPSTNSNVAMPPPLSATTINGILCSLITAGAGQEFVVSAIQVLTSGSGKIDVGRLQRLHCMAEIT